MTKFIGFKSVFLTLVLAICISVITSTNLFAATLTKTYTVKSGDCLSVIAQNHGESLNNLRKANNKWNDLIFPGQFLDVSIISGLTTKQMSKNNVSLKNYTVKSGDCLSVIAQNHGESLNNLRKANNKWNDSIFPGQFLNVSVETISNVKQPRHSVATTSTVKQPRHSVATMSTVKKLAPRSTNYTSSDVNLLAKLITAEAGGTSYNDQVSVGAVVLNRVKSNLFPNSIKAVIYQNSQFTPVTNGSINKTAQASALKAAHSALSGNDPTNKALYFHNDNANNLIFQH